MNDSSVFIARLKRALKNKEAFALYRKPGSNILTSYHPSEVNLFYGDETVGSGFIFSPFDSSEPTILFASETSEIQEMSWDSNEDCFGEDPDNEPSSNQDSTNQSSANQVSMGGAEIDMIAKGNYIDLVGGAIDFLEKSKVSKVVLSRKEELSNISVDPLRIFFRMASNYPDAFVYIWQYPEVGTWAGASPETLLQGIGQNFKTMALAGTQVFKGNLNVEWGAKEQEEQALVTAQIEQELSDCLIKTGAPYTSKAGSLLHLRTDIDGRNDKGKDLVQIIGKLHPTAAICGLPRDKAFQFIKKMEGYSREYYTGFLGELRIPNEADCHLFVNLRCMRLFQDEHKAWIYVGGGITDSSTPEKEWEETVSKSKTMKSVLMSQQ